MITIYSARTGRIRRKIFDAGASDDDLLLRFPPGPGEAAHASADEVTQTELSGITGRTPRDDRYVAVQQATGVVHQVIRGDPAAGDEIPNHDLVPHPRARRNWRMLRNGDFQRSVPEIERDITQQERRITRLNQPSYIANEVAHGLTVAEATEKRDAHLRRANSRKTVFTDEKAARQGPRT